MSISLKVAIDNQICPPTLATGQGQPMATAAMATEAAQTTTTRNSSTWMEEINGPGPFKDKTTATNGLRVTSNRNSIHLKVTMRLSRAQSS